ncbi:solute carrier family 23 protein [Paraburkholderia phenoliruptrix]|uniref:Uracil-xanthine permease n=2 Tax=Paraburkholderia phenoliruptrix TaxID=252970 RepID=K0DEL5_9BURK|nr:solute carrier family 23 protein [Paraburkholderia phenoliruptrix]AFT84286.1 uracil-xanthine permease [Paraburkholderia phenoliruptrix BR3459a]CAB4052316.1 Putative pyrimidine permease RutG [Paraburkholderia phenoliruptrix]
MADSYFPRWRQQPDAVEGRIVGTDERLAWPQMFAMGIQHVVAMFGSTVLAPLLMGFDPNLCIFMSGIGTLLFFVLVGGRVPSYLGSSFAFIGLVIAVTGYGGHGPNPNIPVALGGIIACGAVYAVIGLIVSAVGTRWIETLMPPVVTGAIVCVIGLNLAPIAVRGVSSSNFDSWMALVTVLCVGAVAVFARGMLQRLLILVGLLMAYVIYAILTNGLGMGKPIDFSIVANAAWFGMPHFTAPVFNMQAMTLLAPIAVILVAENLGHIKAVSAMTGQNLDRYIGRAFLGDGLATVVSGFAGGTGVTTYAENIGVMAVTKIYSTLVFVIAAVIALVLGFSPKFGAVIQTIPGPVLGGVSIVVFGLIAVTGARIWVVNKVDFSDNRNLIVAAVTLVLGAGDFSLKLGGFGLGGIGTATFGAIILYALLRRKPAQGPVA